VELNFVRGKQRVDFGQLLSLVLSSRGNQYYSEEYASEARISKTCFAHKTW